MKQTIRLTESRLRSMIAEAVQSVLNEYGEGPVGQYMLGRLGARQAARGQQDKATDTYNYAAKKRDDIGNDDYNYTDRSAANAKRVNSDYNRRGYDDQANIEMYGKNARISGGNDTIHPYTWQDRVHDNYSNADNANKFLKDQMKKDRLTNQAYKNGNLKQFSPQNSKWVSH